MKTYPLRACLLLACLLFTRPLFADSYLLVISGLSGSEEFGDFFHQWSLALIAAARHNGVPESNIVYLGERAEQDQVTAVSDKEGVREAVKSVAAQIQPGDTLFVVLHGHGSVRSKQAYFNIPGPDISAAEFAELLAEISDNTVVFVNTTASSGPFVRALSSPGRVIITATNRAAERYFAEFGGHFSAAFLEESADTDKDNRVSVLEAFAYARLQVKRSYDQDKRLLTEHALLDDNGDGEGSQEADVVNGDGGLARRLFFVGLETLQSTQADAGQDPQTAALLAQKTTIEQAIEALKKRKSELQTEVYYGELEELLVQLALNHRAISSIEK